MNPTDDVIMKKEKVESTTTTNIPEDELQILDQIQALLPLDVYMDPDFENQERQCRLCKTRVRDTTSALIRHLERKHDRVMKYFQEKNATPSPPAAAGGGGGASRVEKKRAHPQVNEQAQVMMDTRVDSNENPNHQTITRALYRWLQSNPTGLHGLDSMDSIAFREWIQIMNRSFSQSLPRSNVVMRQYNDPLPLMKALVMMPQEPQTTNALDEKATLSMENRDEEEEKEIDSSTRFKLESKNTSISTSISCIGYTLEEMPRPDDHHPKKILRSNECLVQVESVGLLFENFDLHSGLGTFCTGHVVDRSRSRSGSSSVGTFSSSNAQDHAIESQLQPRVWIDPVVSCGVCRTCLSKSVMGSSSIGRCDQAHYLGQETTPTATTTTDDDDDDDRCSLSRTTRKITGALVQFLPVTHDRIHVIPEAVSHTMALLVYPWSIVQAMKHKLLTLTTPARLRKKKVRIALLGAMSNPLIYMLDYQLARDQDIELTLVLDPDSDGGTTMDSLWMQRNFVSVIRLGTLKPSTKCIAENSFDGFIDVTGQGLGLALALYATRPLGQLQIWSCPWQESTHNKNPNVNNPIPQYYLNDLVVKELQLHYLSHVESRTYAQTLVEMTRVSPQDRHYYESLFTHHMSSMEDFVTRYRRPSLSSLCPSLVHHGIKKKKKLNNETSPSSIAIYVQVSPTP